MQKGSLIRSFALRVVKDPTFGSTAREARSGQTRKHRRIVIGTPNTFRDESAALKVIPALRKDININDRRLRTKPLKTRGTGRARSAEVHFSNLLLAEEELPLRVADESEQDAGHRRPSGLLAQLSQPSSTPGFARRDGTRRTRTSCWSDWT
jgi:hypothetical protein